MTDPLPLGRTHCANTKCAKEMPMERRRLLMTYCSYECARDATLASISRMFAVPHALLGEKHKSDL